MSVCLEILPNSDQVTMVGRPDRSSAYSISGQVAISLRSSWSYFDKTRRPARMLLSSLSLTFEGQSELMTPNTGYCPFRLCTETHDITPPGGPYEFSNEGQEDLDKPCTWNVVFSIPIPGWLPASASFGDDLHGNQAGISYNLYASAKFTVLEDSSPGRSLFSLASLCSALTTRTRTAEAPRCGVIISRVIPTTAEGDSSGPLFDRVLYQTDVQSDIEPEHRDEHHIPYDVLKRIKVSVFVPEHLSLDDDQSVPITLKMASQGMTEDQCSRFSVTGFTADIQQLERYRSSCSSTYKTAFPVPRRAQQTSRIPLRNPHTLGALYDMGVVVNGAQADPGATREFSVMSSDCPGTFVLSGPTNVFSRDAHPALANATESTIRSFGVDASIPIGASFDDAYIDSAEVKRYGWTSSRRLRPTVETPHFSVRHGLCLALHCTWDNEGTEVKETLRLMVPLSFVHACRSPTHPSSPQQLAALLSTTTLSSIPSFEHLPSPSQPYADCKPILPPYCQLYHSNGDRRINYDLPQYEALPTSDTILLY